MSATTRIELAIIARLQKENDVLKAKLESMKPVVGVEAWLRDKLATVRLWAVTAMPKTAEWNANLRDWLEAVLDESPESDPLKDRRTK